MTIPDLLLQFLLGALALGGSLLVGIAFGRRSRRRPSSDRRHFNRIKRTYPETARERRRSL